MLVWKVVEKNGKNTKESELEITEKEVLQKNHSLENLMFVINCH